MDNPKNIDLMSLIGDDQNIITYRPKWNQFTGSVNATILLQQILYRWVKNGRKPFYKFSAPCSTRGYRPGDSWQEELGMTRYEFESSRKKIARKTRGDRDKNKFISYWVTADRKTWYALNEVRLIEELVKLHPPQQNGGVGIQSSLLMLDSNNSPMLDSNNSPMLDSSNSPMLDSSNSPMLDSSNSPMLDFSNSPMLDSSNSINNKDNNKDNNKEDNKEDQQTTTTEMGLHGSKAVDVVDAIANWAGYVGSVPEDERQPPDLMLAWAYVARCEKPGHNPIGIVRKQWQQNRTPSARWLALARLWLNSSNDLKLALIDSAEDSPKEFVFTRTLEDLGVSRQLGNLFLVLWQKTSGDIAPDCLMPNESGGFMD